MKYHFTCAINLKNTELLPERAAGQEILSDDPIHMPGSVFFQTKDLEKDRSNVCVARDHIIMEGVRAKNHF